MVDTNGYGRISNGSAGSTVTYSVGAKNTSTTYAGRIYDNGNGGTGALVALTKVGSGKLTLSGNNNTYTGDTNITGGTLSLDTTGTVGSSLINVGSGTSLNVSTLTGGYHLTTGKTILGNGTVIGPFSLDAGAYIGPGSSLSSIGLLHTVGNVTMNGTYNWKLGDLTDQSTGTAGTDWDQIQMASGTLAGARFLNLAFLNSTSPDNADPFWSANHSWTVVDNLGSGAATLTGGDITGYGVHGVAPKEPSRSLSAPAPAAAAPCY